MLMQPISSFISFLEPPTVIFDKVPKDTDFFPQRGGEAEKQQGSGRGEGKALRDGDV